jgi:ribosomal protein L24E
MSKTDKTRPAWVRLIEAGAEVSDHPYIRGRRSFKKIPRDFKWTNAERNRGGPGYIRWAKRYRSKKNRRREVPHTAMRGYGWSHENYRRLD